MNLKNSKKIVNLIKKPKIPLKICFLDEYIL